jgi:hypothetical protein
MLAGMIVLCGVACLKPCGLYPLSHHETGNQRSIVKTLIFVMCMAGLSALAFAQNAPATPPRIAPADAKSHVNETVTVCGKVVDTKVSKYGVAGHGKPVTFDIDQPEPNPVFYFVAFGSETGGTDEVVGAYQAKSVCVTGKINMRPSNPPFILAADRSQIKVQPQAK